MHLTPPPPNYQTCLFFGVITFFVDAPPIPHLVNLLHAFDGIVAEQFKKRVEKVLSDSILLWRLLKLLFKILKWRSWVGYLCFNFFFYPFWQFYSFSQLVYVLLFSGSFSWWIATKTTPHSSRRSNSHFCTYLAKIGCFFPFLFLSKKCFTAKCTFKTKLPWIS